MVIEAHQAAALAGALRRQHNVATRRQLMAAGIKDMTICRKIRRGEWQRLASGVYALGRGSLSTEQRRIAAALYTGGCGQITSLGALHWCGFRSAPATEKVHIIVAHRMRRRSTGFIIVHRTHTLDPLARPAGPYSVVSVARAVVDAGRDLDDLRSVRAIVAEAVQSRLVRIEDLVKEVGRAGTSRTAHIRRAVADIAGGPRSAPEAELREILLSRCALPEILWNPSLVAPDGTRLPTPDAYIPAAALALEVDSREHHADDVGWRRTLSRGNRMEQHGVAVLHFTPSEIRDTPDLVLQAVEQTCAVRMARGAAVSGSTPLYGKREEGAPPNR